MEKKIIIKAGRESSILRRHPWIFSGSIGEVKGNPYKGETIAVESADGVFLGKCGYNPESSIQGRMWTFGEEEVDVSFIKERMRIATFLRRKINYLNSFNNSCRLIYAESDSLPGLVADQYDSFLVVQFLTAAIEKWKREILQALAEMTGIKNIYERSDVDVRQLEGLDKRSGTLMGEEPPEIVEITENGLHFLVDIKHGQKTGFYLDQRINRTALLDFAENKSLLNCFSYSGSFAVYGLKAGANSITSIDSSDSANQLAKENIRLNNMDTKRTKFITGDVFKEMRLLRDAGYTFDLIILDPPKFAATRAQTKAAARGYKDINLLAFKMLKPGGILFTFSCSGGVSRALFQKIVADAALDARVNAVILKQLSQAPDHPIALNFPEGEYLKGLVCIRQ